MMMILMLFVFIKATCELVRNNISTNKKKPVYDSFMHSNQHMTYLLGLMIYKIIHSVSYFLLFENGFLDDKFVHSITWLNSGILNILFLLMIDHFKQERQGRTRRTKISDIFKF